MPAKKGTAMSKPTYAVMVQESIKSIGDRTGSSVQAITKQLQSQYNIEINKPALIKAIKKGVESGELIQIKASYKLGKKTPTATKPKKPAATVTKKKPPAKPRTTTRAKAAPTKPKKTIAKRAKPATTTKKSTTTAKKAASKRTTAKRTTVTKKKITRK